MRNRNRTGLGWLLTAASLAFGAGCVSEEREQPADSTVVADRGLDAAAPTPDAAPTLDSTPPVPDTGTSLDASPPPDEGLRDADPRALADLWSPDFGPPPDDMPEEIRWMHGKMWCDAPRPPRVMPDGSSECDHVDVLTPPGPYFADRPDYIVNHCRAWPSRTAEQGLGGGAGIDAWIGCSPDYSLCCTFYPYEEDAPAPCGWRLFEVAADHQSVLPPEMEAAMPWLEARGLRAIVPTHDPGSHIPAEVSAAWQTALNNCHPVCKRPACGP